MQYYRIKQTCAATAGDGGKFNPEINIVVPPIVEK